LPTFSIFGVDFVRRFINETEDEIIRGLIKECNQLDEPQDRICRTFVEVIGRDIIKYIKMYGGEPEEVCKRFRICRPTEIKPVVQLPEAPKQICQFCIYGVQTVVNFLNESEDFIIEKANEQCNQLGETPKRLCLTLVSLFGRQVIRYIKEYGAENPREVCQRFRLCTVSLLEVPTNVITQQEPKALCTACILAVSQIQRMINESEEEIVRTLLQQCALLPEQLQQYCRLVVNLYAKDLIDYVRTRIGEPRTLCQRIGICRTEESEKTPVSKKTQFI